MEWTVVSCVVFAIFLSIRAEPVVTSSPQEDLTPDPSALNCSGQTVREGAQLMLQCYVKHGDTFIMERANSNLREQLKEGDKLLKEQIEEGLTYEKEERKEGDRRLKEYLDEEVACLREKLARDRRYLRDELEDCERKTNEVEEELGKVRDSVRQCTQLSSAVDDLRQQMSDFQAELKSTQHQLQTTQNQLQTAEEKLQTTQQQLQTAQEEIRFLKASDVVKEEMLNSTQAGLETTQNQLQTTQEEVGSLMASDVDKEQRLNSTQAGLEKTQNQLRTTQNQLRTTQNQLQTTQNQLQSTQNQLRSTQNQLQSIRNQLQTTQNQLQSTQEQIGSLKASDVGSSFVRWGHGQCPSSTSLVYSGVAGGSWYKNTGGGSNFLCLGMTPEMDNTTLPSAFSGVHGAEYQAVPGRDNQDVVCSVCRAPQATTLMIPATRTCPSGWTAQYRGYIMAGLWEQKGRTDFVCVDENREYRQGGGADKNGALFYPVATWCASSLPCPPYVDRKVVTCVVCSV